MTPRVASILAVVTLALAWSGALSPLGAGPFSAHMTAHMLVVAIASPLVVAAVSATRWDPVPKMPRLFAPIPASVVELVLVWTWHVPALHQAARAEAPLYVLEQATFLFAGLLLWFAAAGSDRTGGVARGAAGIAALLFTSMHMTLLGALFALTPRPLFVHAGHGTPAAALADQHAGGVIMLLVGGASYLAGGLWLTRRTLVAGAPAVEAT